MVLGRFSLLGRIIFFIATFVLTLMTQGLDSSAANFCGSLKTLGLNAAENCLLGIIRSDMLALSAYVLLLVSLVWLLWPMIKSNKPIKMVTAGLVLIFIGFVMAAVGLYRHSSGIPYPDLPIVVSTTNDETKPDKLLQRRYSPSEKDKLLDLLGVVDQLANKDGMFLVVEAQKVGGHQIPINKSEFNDFLKRAENVRETAIRVYKQLWDELIPENPNFSRELAVVIGSRGHFQRLISAAEQFHNHLVDLNAEFAAFSDNQRIFISRVMSKRNDLTSAGAQLADWREAIDKRIQQARHELSIN